MEADRDREMVDVIVKKIEAEERAEQEQYLKSRYVCRGQKGKWRQSVKSRGDTESVCVL